MAASARKVQKNLAPTKVPTLSLIIANMTAYLIITVGFKVEIDNTGSFKLLFYQFYVNTYGIITFLLYCGIHRLTE